MKDTEERISFIKWAISSSKTKKEAIEKLGCDPSSGGGYRTLRRFISKYNIDTSHFDKVKPIKRSINYTDEMLFCENSNIKRERVKKRFIEINEYTCCICNNVGIHNGIPLTLQLDHINGINNDNRLSNLRLLCPNCHSQTSTYCSKNISSKQKVKRTKDEYYKSYWVDWLVNQSEKILMVRNSGINFQKHGWKTKVANIVGIKRQHVDKWISRAMPELLG